MVKKLSKHHYLATPGHIASSDQALMSPGYLHRGINRGYSTDGEDSQRAPSERTMSEYTVTNEKTRVVPDHKGSSSGSHGIGRKHKDRSRHSRSHDRGSRSRERETRSHDRGSRAQSAGSHVHHPHHGHLTENEGSDIYVTSAAYRAPSEMSHGSRYSRQSRVAPSQYSYRSGRAPSEMSRGTVKTKVDKKRGLVVETMAAPNPFCPNTKGMCCLMLLLNLGIILVTLGFVIVVQFFEPVFVWILGIVFLIFGFLTLIGSLIYCVTVCRDVKSPSQVAQEDHYWTHHWQKNIGSPPEIHYKAEDKYHTDNDRYSTGYSEKQSERNGKRY